MNDAPRAEAPAYVCIMTLNASIDYESLLREIGPLSHLIVVAEKNGSASPYAFARFTNDFETMRAANTLQSVSEVCARITKLRPKILEMISGESSGVQEVYEDANSDGEDYNRILRPFDSSLEYRRRIDNYFLSNSRRYIPNRRYVNWQEA